MKAIISAGGTGGHIYPALSIARKLQEDNFEILYIGTTTRMEKDIVPEYKIPYYGIRVTGFDRKHLFKNVKTLYYFLKSVHLVKNKIKEFKPDIVIGVGGYVTAPVIYAASLLKVKCVIHEQNSSLGMTNKFLSKYADIVFTSFPETKVDARKVVYSGNPSYLDTNLNFNKNEFNLSNNKKLVVIVMGSLGSKTVNEKMKQILPNFKDKDYEVLFITGKDYYDEFNSLNIPNNVKIVPFIDNLKRVLKNTDLLVSRAGATTISEIISYKVPSILIPSMYVTDNHQFKNASSMVNKGLSLLLEEKDLDNLISEIDKTINNTQLVNQMKSNLAAREIKSSNEIICNNIKELIDG